MIMIKIFMLRVFSLIPVSRVSLRPESLILCNKLRYSEALGNKERKQTENLEHRAVLENIRENLQMNVKDWYTESGTTLRKHGAGKILKQYGSYSNCIQQIYSHHTWHPMQFKVKSRDFWEDLGNQRKFMEELATRMNITEPKDWLGVKVSTFRKEGGHVLFRKYKTFLELLSSIYPEERWEEYKQRTPRRYWAKEENVRSFLDSFAQKHGITTPSEWKNITHAVIKKEEGGSSLLSFYQYSLGEILKKAFPSTNWATIRKGVEEESYKKQIRKTNEEIREIFEEIGVKLGIKRWQDWYSIPSSTIRKETNTIRYFKNKYECLKNVYPEHDWNVFQFTRMPNQSWSDIKIQKQFFEFVKKELGLTTEQLLTVPMKRFFALGGTGLMKAHNSQKYTILSQVYPELKQVDKEKGYWDCKGNQIKWVKQLEEQLEFRCEKDWESLSIRGFTEVGGAPLLRKYRSIRNMLSSLFPEKDWSNLQQHLPNQYWKSLENQRQFLEEVMEKEGIQEVTKLKDIPRKKIHSYGGSTLLTYYPSYYECLCTVFPEEKWNIFAFKYLPKNFWEKKENHKLFLDHFAKERGLKAPKDWYYITSSDIKEAKGFQLLKKYSNFHHVLSSIYPDEDWNVFKSRKTVPKNYWKSEENCRAFLDTFARKYQISTAVEWGRVSKAEIIKAGGSGILYKRGLLKTLKKFYPEICWTGINEVTRIPATHWDKEENVQDFVKKLEGKFRITNPSEWTRVSGIQIRKEGGHPLLHRFGGVYGLVSSVYPDYDWPSIKYLFDSKDKRATQRMLFVYINEIFHSLETEIVEEFIHDDLTRKLGRAIEFDIFMPAFQIGLEYHGKHHYADIPSFGMLELYQDRDKEKEELAAAGDISLIVIPYWWDNSVQTLKGTLSIRLHTTFPLLFPRPFPKPIAKTQ